MSLDLVSHPDGPCGEKNRGAESKDAEESRTKTDVVDRGDAPDEAGCSAQEAGVVDEVVGEAVLLDPEHDLAGTGSEGDGDSNDACHNKNRVDEHRAGESESAQNRREH